MFKENDAKNVPIKIALIKRAHILYHYVNICEEILLNLNCNTLNM